eukprot:4017998-Amphidinium_carterae.1
MANCPIARTHLRLWRVVLPSQEMSGIALWTMMLYNPFAERPECEWCHSCTVRGILGGRCGAAPPENLCCSGCA